MKNVTKKYLDEFGKIENIPHYDHQIYDLATDLILSESVIHLSIHYKNIMEMVSEEIMSKASKNVIKYIYDHSPSHQIIYDWIKDTRSKSTNSDKSNRSGYYCYDEQYLKIDGNRFYRLSMYDSIIDKIVLRYCR